MSLHVTSVEDRSRYDAFLETLTGDENLTFYHAWEWGELMSDERPELVRVEITDGETTVAVGQVGLHVDRRLKPIKWWYCPRGLAMDYSNPTMVTAAYAALRDYFKGRSGGAFLRVDPNVEQGSAAEAALDALHPKKAPVFVQVERCWIVDIQPTEEQQWAWMKDNGMSSKIKRFTNKARKADVRLRVSDDAADVDAFLALLHNLDERKGGIGIHDDGHYVRQFNKLAPAGAEKLFMVEKDGEIGAINMIAIYGGEASYLHGASSKAEFFRPLSPATMLHFETMRWLAEHRPDVKRYNFWGVISDENRALGNHPRHGYSEFKRSFGGYKVEYVRARDFVYNPAVHFVSYQADAYRTRKAQND